MRQIFGYPLIALFGFFILGHAVGEILHITSHILSRAAFEWHAHYQEAKRFMEGDPSTTRPSPAHSHDGQGFHIHSNDTWSQQGVDTAAPAGHSEAHIHHPVIRFLNSKRSDQAPSGQSDILLLISFTNFLFCPAPSGFYPLAPDGRSGQVISFSGEVLLPGHLSVPTPPPRYTA